MGSHWRVVRISMTIWLLFKYESFWLFKQQDNWVPAWLSQLVSHLSVQNQSWYSLSNLLLLQWEVNHISAVLDAQTKTRVFFDFCHSTCPIDHQILFITFKIYPESNDISLSLPHPPESSGPRHVDYCYSRLASMHPASVFSHWLSVLFKDF